MSADLQALLASFTERDAPSAKTPPPTRLLNYSVTVDLATHEHTYVVDPDLLAAAQADPDLYVAPAVIKVRFTGVPERQPLPAPERELSFGELIELYG